jgi:uncharacterized protein (TIGR04255 family)
VNEVVFGLTFSPPPNFTVAHVGRFWEQNRFAFQRCEEHPPVVSATETFDRRGTLEEVPGPFFPRLWLLTNAGNHLLQIQRDRFLSNWRRTSESDDYPRYGALSKEFFRLAEDFEEFFQNVVGSDLNPCQYELTYINHVFVESHWSDLAKIGTIFRDLEWKNHSERFLPAPESVNHKLSFRLPDMKGRLHVKVISGNRLDDDRTAFIFELLARGYGEDRSAWFEMAHEWIVRGFADLTDLDGPNQEWGRTK